MAKKKKKKQKKLTRRQLRSLQRSLETIERRKNQEEASNTNVGAVIGGILFLFGLFLNLYLGNNLILCGKYLYISFFH